MEVGDGICSDGGVRTGEAASGTRLFTAAGGVSAATLRVCAASVASRELFRNVRRCNGFILILRLVFLT
jgi:hypothetical protein